MPNLWVSPDELQADGASPFAYEAAKTASFILWALSGRKYAGTHTITEQYECPCNRYTHYPARLWNQAGLFPIEPYLEDGAVKNSGPCGCSGPHTRLRLRNRPVRSIQRVTRGDEIVDPSSYRLVSGSALTAAPGHSFDPCGTTVTYTYGVEPPMAGRRAARYLAQELAKGWEGKDCDLPERVTSISRQGVQYTILDDQAFLDDMRTGIYSVDLFLKAVNPDNARKPARVFSPDMPRATRVIRTGQQAAPVGPYDLVVTPGEETVWTVNLLEINADILTNDDWEPQAQITSWNGATLLEFTSDRFSISGNTLEFTLSPEEAGTITGDGTFDLYAGSTFDDYTIIHLLTSSVRVAS